MPSVEKISIALPAEMADLVRRAVEAGEYASNSEVVRDALRDWTRKRNLREQSVKALGKMWKQALADKSPGVGADDVLNRLEKKYRAVADASSK